MKAEFKEGMIVEFSYGDNKFVGEVINLREDSEYIDLGVNDDRFTVFDSIKDITTLAKNKGYSHYYPAEGFEILRIIGNLDSRVIPDKVINIFTRKK